MSGFAPSRPSASRPSGLRRGLRLGALAAGAGVATGAAASLGAATYFARRVLTPDHRRVDDQRILALDQDTIVLGLNPDAAAPGRYGLWFEGGRGHLRIGEITSIDVPASTVRRKLESRDVGVPAPGPARWNPYYWWGAPDSCLDLPTEHVQIAGEFGAMPAWMVPGPAGPSRRWAVLVHGRGALREETVRAIPTLHAAGCTVLVPSYRNDDGVPPGRDGRYNLGLSEWRDVEAAVRHALAHGADEIVLGGWSMGGAIVLQWLARSALAPMVSRVVLDAPVVDWADVLRHHSRLNHIPGVVATLAETMMGHSWGRRLVGVHDVLDVAQTNWVARADELRHPMLLLHSADDDFVPVGPSRALAESRPDLVTFEEFQTARHCQEWNVDAARWEAALTDFLAG